jgi:hypothetical protein
LAGRTGVSLPSKGPLEARVKRVGQPGEAEAIHVDEAVVEADLPPPGRRPVETDSAPVHDATVHELIGDIHV